ncbi:hypothetical protein [Neolewinella persica]|uniref:hypothetical protein n=1 Tax=Neolewinella persica TaxID=70998 RepID=UPI000369AE45|nr:hypothetical protein [Neolewinella persica]
MKNNSQIRIDDIFNIETIHYLRVMSLVSNCTILLSFFLLISCSNESANNKDIPQSEVVSVVGAEKSAVSEVESRKDIDADSFRITERITDYYHLFGIGVDLNYFKNLTRAQAHKQKSFVLGTLNHNKGFLRFHTSNTPLDWDGDAETEWSYEMTYWNLKDSRRFIALVTNVVTWVSEETDSTAFYVHDREGVKKVHWDGFSWDLGDFIGQEYESLFDERVWTHPPVYIMLPEEGKEIQVELAFHEYMENENAYGVYDSLQLFEKESMLKFNPLTDF